MATATEKLTTLEVDIVTGKQTQRDLTADEITQREAEAKTEKATAKAQEATATARIDARASALAKLAKLGLTKAEIEAL